LLTVTTTKKCENFFPRLRSPVVEAKTVEHTLNIFHYKTFPDLLHFTLHD
jgi:hypothetical protein